LLSIGIHYHSPALTFHIFQTNGVNETKLYRNMKWIIVYRIYVSSALQNVKTATIYTF